MAFCSSSLASHRLKYDVFLNFRGEDTRRGFISHLRDAFDRKGLQIFFDDDGLKRGEEIAPSLLLAIQESAVAILVFSKKYASSRWCLDELAEIIDCHHSHGQIVIPIFYEVDPAHLRKQSHKVAAAFVKHEQNFVNADKIERWKKALTTAASLSGFHSKNFGNDIMLIEEIVEDIFKKLNQSLTCDDFRHLVGIDSRIQEIKRVFTIDPYKVNILGICGMGGIGKTTTAEVIYNIMSPEFEGCCSVYDVRQKAEAIGLRNLLEELVSKAMGKDNLDKGVSNERLRLSLKRILCRKKILIFLDDVNDPYQLKELIGDVNDDPDQLKDLIGDVNHPRAGSMILITSRNKQVFGGRNAFIYEVEPLNYYDALLLFSKSAFNKKYPRDDHASLPESIVKYAQGNPLALKLLGSALIGKEKEKWESALHQLSTVPNNDIQQVLKVSYDNLDRVQKDVFLDMACFFKDVDEDILKKVYQSSGLNINCTLSVLKDKCLITSKDTAGTRYWSQGMTCTLGMHDLLQEMGKEIVRQEAKYSYQRSRLWDPQDIYEVFDRYEEAEAVETITLDLSKIRKMDLSPQVFTKMRHLRFLNFYGESNLCLSEDLNYLPNTLQYLRWDKYPLESLPPNFQQENLVVLELPNSNIKQLLKGDSLVSQVKHGIVNGFRILTSLILVQNKSIAQLPNSRSGFLEALEILDLRGCSNLNTFPEISSNIKRLYLDKTAIRQIPSSSDERPSQLEYLSMKDCRELESLPSNFFSKSTFLCELNLSGCSRFKVLPEILEPMRRDFVYLNLSETVIEKLPSIIGNCKGIWMMNMSKCPKLQLEMSKYSLDKKPTEKSLDELYREECLDLSNCNMRELPEDLSFLSFVCYLNLSENDFKRIPATFKQLSQLERLEIYDCKSLLSLPELPSNVNVITACKCRSLKEIGTLKQLPTSRHRYYHFDFGNCLKLDEDECQEIVNALLGNYTRSHKLEKLESFKMVYPGSRIPEWVKYQSMGDSIQICLPSHWFNDLFLGFAFYLCVQSNVGIVHHNCYFGDNYFYFNDRLHFDNRKEGNEHMAVIVDKTFCESIRRHSHFKEGVASFKFWVPDIPNGIKKWGVIPLYAQKDENEFFETFDFPNLGGSKLKRSATGARSFHCIPKKRLKIEEIE